MNDPNRQAHWENVYTTKDDTEVSWFEQTPLLSLELIRAAGATPKSAIIDIGGGASRLVDVLLDEGFADVSVLDISATALATAKARLGARAAQATWIAADVTRWQPPQRYAVWHDRAAFHFLTEPDDRTAYVACLKKALAPGGYAIIGAFATDGPERCSGLPVVRYDADSLGATLGEGFVLQHTRRHEHRTPGGVIQRFQFSVFRR
jgi:SAM-dependent methyltransferase